MTAERAQRPALPFHLFDRDADVAIVNRKLPHWSQPGTVAFITWRTNDSMPAPVLRQWFADRDRWLKAHAIDPARPNWRETLAELDRRLVVAFLEAFWNHWQDALDACHGACVLKSPEMAEIVAKSLRHFDDDLFAGTLSVVGASGSARPCNLGAIFDPAPPRRIGRRRPNTR